MRPVCRLVPDFIVPSLDRSTYGVHLHWEDREHGSFKISRIHQSSEMWNEQCIEVYKDWSLKKKLWNARDPKRITKAKHRLITALRRNPDIEMLKREATFYRFRLVQQNVSGDRVCREMKDQPLPAIAREEEVENREAPHPGTKRRPSDSVLTSSCGSNVYRTELYDEPRGPAMPETLFGDEVNPDEGDSSGVSDRCCCEILLDNFLCNQKCIWHGMPP